MFGRRKAAMIVAEFLGTGVLTLLVLSVQRSTIGVPFFVAMAGGLTVALMMFALGSTSGAHMNPAITIAMWTARKIATLHAVVYVAVQLLGAWAAYYLYTYFVNSKLSPIGGHFTARVLAAEAAGAVIFGFAWAAAVYQRYSTPTKAAVVGVAYMLAIIAASSASIGLVNPALALGVRAWVPGTYILGPVLGAVIGVNLYGLLFAEPETAKAAAAVSSSSSSASSSASASKPAARAKKAPAKRKTTAKKK
jgi:glycerol uptake facilitator-like aquaporin